MAAPVPGEGEESQTLVGRKRVFSRRQVLAMEAVKGGAAAIKPPVGMRANLVVSAKDIIRLETISWIGRIKRNHGF